MSQLLDLYLVVLDEFLQLEVAVLAGLVVLPLQHVEALLSYLLNEVAAVAVEVIGQEAVAVAAFGVAVVLAVTGGHVGATEVVAAVGLLQGLNLSAADAAEGAAWHRVTQTDILAEYIIELAAQVGLLFDLDSGGREEGHGVLLLLLVLRLSSQVICHDFLVFFT